MRQHFDICGDYQADNPFGERQPLKHSFMKYAFLAYKKARISISKFWPLKEWQEYLWREDELLDFRQFDNSAVKCIDDEPPFFHIKYISILELIPKEDWNVESYHIADKLCYCLLYEKVSQYVRNKLSMFSNKISNNRRNLRSWLKLKVDFDAEMFFSTRFLNEVEEQTNNSFSYITLRPSKETFISAHYSDLFESVRRTVNLYTGISALFQSNIDYMSAKNNFSTQNKALYVSILAVIVAIISIVITIIIAIATNEDAIKKLFELLQTFVNFEK